MGAAWNWRALWARHPTRPRPKARPREREFELSLWWEWGLLPRLNLTSSVDMVDKSPWCTHTHTPFMTWAGLSRHRQPCHFASSNDTRGAMSDVSLCSQSWGKYVIINRIGSHPLVGASDLLCLFCRQQNDKHKLIFYVYWAVISSSAEDAKYQCYTLCDINKLLDREQWSLSCVFIFDKNLRVPT